MSANWNVGRMLRWTTLAGLVAATVALNATPAAADDGDWNGGHRDWNGNGDWNGGDGDWNHHRHHRRDYYDNGNGYGYYRERPRYYYEPPPTYYYPPPQYYEPPPAYYYEPPAPYYDPSFSFGLTVPIH